MEREIIATLIGVVAVIWIIIAAVAVVRIIGQWKAFKKAGKGGWEALIPVYNLIVQCQISGVNPLWIAIVMLGGIVLNIIPVLGSLCSAFLLIYFMVVLSVSTARSYGKDDGFGIGLMFLSPIFWPLLGFSKNTNYVGIRPMKDPIWEFLEKTFGGKTTNNSVNSSTNNSYASNASSINNFCRDCGAKLEDNAKFCQSCGKEVK